MQCAISFLSSFLQVYGSSNLYDGPPFRVSGNVTEFSLTIVGHDNSQFFILRQPKSYNVQVRGVVVVGVRVWSDEPRRSWCDHWLHLIFIDYEGMAFLIIFNRFMLIIQLVQDHLQKLLHSLVIVSDNILSLPPFIPF